ncbi:b(0,+)-type amino acid transporter 1-like [Mytilus californianus]|uniref:b(0,+)-type amino acid transporter 1-like n=1 Tax=Mytilus californianus TaxID=6549 RepID=UPI0022460686|nr:b(0,+)-type amino acid transporter 1-like [Mytilus californianus]
MENKAFQEDDGKKYGTVDNGTRQRTFPNGTDKDDSHDYENVKEKNDTGGVVIEPIKLKRSVGLISGTSLIVGTIIGSGIFISPTDVLDRTGSVGLSLVIWSLSGLLALLGALSYSELGTMIRKSGGEYAYMKEAYGDVMAFLFAWTSVIVIRTSSVAIISLTFGEYMATFFPMCGSPENIKKLVAIVVIVTIAVVNCIDTTLAVRMQVFFTAAKLIALMIIVVGGLIRLGQGHVSQLKDSFKGSETNPSSIALAFYNALWAYDGWNNLNYVTEEIEDPKKNLPRANIIAVLLVTIVYILTNISYLTAMTAAELLTVDAVAVTWGDTVLGGAAILMPLAVLFSTFGAANGTLFSGGRVVYVASREGHLPEVLSYVHCKRVTPMPSIVFTALISIAMVIPGNIGSLIDFFSFTAWLFYGLTVGSLILLRFTRKDLDRPLKIPIIIPIIFVLIACYLVIGPIVQDPKIEFLYAFLFVIGGLLFYIPFVYFKIELRIFAKVTEFFQLLCEIVPSPYEPDD